MQRWGQSGLSKGLTSTQTLEWREGGSFVDTLGNSIHTERAASTQAGARTDLQGGDPEGQVWLKPGKQGWERQVMRKLGSPAVSRGSWWGSGFYTHVAGSHWRARAWATRPDLWCRMIWVLCWKRTRKKRVDAGREMAFFQKHFLESPFFLGMKELSQFLIVMVFTFLM